MKKGHPTTTHGKQKIATQKCMKAPVKCQRKKCKLARKWVCNIWRSKCKNRVPQAIFVPSKNVDQEGPSEAISPIPSSPALSPFTSMIFVACSTGWLLRRLCFFCLRAGFILAGPIWQEPHLLRPLCLSRPRGWLLYPMLGWPHRSLYLYLRCQQHSKTHPLYCGNSLPSVVVNTPLANCAQGHPAPSSRSTVPGRTHLRLLMPAVCSSLRDPTTG